MSLKKIYYIQWNYEKNREKIKERLKAAFEKRKKHHKDSKKKGHKIHHKGRAFGKLVRDDEKVKELRDAFAAAAKGQKSIFSGMPTIAGKNTGELAELAGKKTCVYLQNSGLGNIIKQGGLAGFVANELFSKKIDGGTDIQQCITHAKQGRRPAIVITDGSPVSFITFKAV